MLLAWRERRKFSRLKTDLHFYAGTKSKAIKRENLKNSA